MVSTAEQIYHDISQRTGGDIYIGVVGPVRTGKSTFVKRVMETLVIPNIENVYRRERARDELPQSGSGRTIMTAEPKFVPEEAVEITPDGTASLSVRMIDSVGYMVPGAVGAEEDGAPRMVTTPWFNKEIPMTEAAELGTKKIMEEHCTIGIVVTSDGTITDIPRQDYIEAEARAIRDMKETGKPFLVLINSSDPNGAAASDLKKELEQTYQVRCMCINCLLLQEQEVCDILAGVLREFPVTEVRFFLPRWMERLPMEHSMKAQLYDRISDSAGELASISEAEPVLKSICQMETVDEYRILSVDTATGVVSCELLFPEHLFYQVLSEATGLQVENDGELMDLMTGLSEAKKDYDKISAALEQARATGYGIVMPTPEEMQLEEPKIVRKGSNYSVRMKASAPSIHMLRADIETEVCPLVGDEKQSEDLMQYLMREYDGDIDKLWSSNIFGRTVFELVNEGLGAKLHKMPEASRMKLQSTLSRIINEESSGLLCIILT